MRLYCIKENWGQDSFLRLEIEYSFTSAYYIHYMPIHLIEDDSLYLVCLWQCPKRTAVRLMGRRSAGRGHFWSTSPRGRYSESR